MYQLAKFGLLYKQAIPQSGAVEAAAWAAAVVTAGGSVSGGRQSLVAAMIAGLKTDGIWAKLDRLWVFAAENSQSALIDMVALDQGSVVNAPTFTTDRGYAGNGSSSYVNTTFNPSTQGVQYTVNSASLFAWNRTSRAVADKSLGFCYDLSSNYLQIYPRFSDGNSYFRINTVNTTGRASSDSAGFWHGVRTSSTAVQDFRNGASLGTASQGSSGIPSIVAYVGAMNGNGIAESFSDDQIAVAGFGAGMSATEAAALYSRLQTYMTAVGA